MQLLSREEKNGQFASLAIGVVIAKAIFRSLDTVFQGISSAISLHDPLAFCTDELD
jgi:hypothetical protein